MNVFKTEKVKSLSVSKQLRNGQKGESLISVFLGAMLVMFVIGVSLSATDKMMYGNQVSLDSPSICREAATNVLNIIRSNGVQSKVFDVPIDSDSVRLNNNNWHNGELNYNPSGVDREFGLSNAYYRTRWPRAKVVRWNGTANHVSHGPRLIHGSINALLSIYNSSPQVCTNQYGLKITGSSALSDLEPPRTIDNHDIEASIRIRPYNLRNGVLLACNRNLGIRPPAIDEPPRAEQYNILDLSNYRADRGLEVEVFVTVDPSDKENQRGQQARNNKKYTCSFKNRFQYDQAATKPLPPTLSVTGSTVRVEFPRNAAGDYVNSPGSQIICRQSHFQHSSNQLAAARASHARRGSAAVQSPDSGGWAPCDLMRVCNRRPNNVRTDNRHKSMTLNYSIPNQTIVWCPFKLELWM